MGDHSVDQVRDFYRDIDAYVGLAGGQPAFLVERYHPADDEIGSKYEVREGDMGMHFLVAPTDRARPRLHARRDRPRDGADVRRPGGATAWWWSPTCATRPCMP